MRERYSMCRAMARLYNIRVKDIGKGKDKC